MEVVDLKIEGDLGPSLSVSKSHATLTDRVTYFKVQASCRGKTNVFITRFSELADLHDRLAAALSLGHQLPPFPERSIATLKIVNTDHLSANFVDERVVQINEFFRTMWAVPFVKSLPEVYTFMKFADEAELARQQQAELQKERAMKGDTTNQFTVTFGDYKTVETIVYYSFRLDIRTGESRVLEKRFSDFQALHTQMRSNYEVSRSAHLIKNFPEFPSAPLKLFVDHTKPEFLQRRKDALEVWFQQLLRLPHASTDVHLLYFLGLWTAFEPPRGFRLMSKVV